MTLVSNHVPLATVVISPNEYEGHFAFELLYNNTSEIQPRSLATDNHGVNNVNFAILDIFEYLFMVRKLNHLFINILTMNIIVRNAMIPGSHSAYGDKMRFPVHF